MHCKRLCRSVFGFLTLVCLSVMPVMASAPLPTAGQSATQMPDGRWLLLGGQDALLGTVQLFDPGTGQTTVGTQGPVTPRAFHSATLLPDGKVLVLGGIGADGLIVRSAEIYDLASQRFTALPDTGLIPRARHTATVLMDGRVLVAGGISERGALVAESEIWDPATGRPAGGARLINPRMGHDAAILPADPVLISGGQTEAGVLVSVPELYMPQQGAFVTAQDGDTLAPRIGAPTVQATIPADGSIDVALDGRIAVRFNKPLRMASLTTQTVTLLGPGGTIPIQVVPVEGGMLLFATPRTQLSPAARYTLFIAGAADAQGFALPLTGVGFTTRRLEPAPNQPVTASTSTNTAPSSRGPHSAGRQDNAANAAPQPKDDVKAAAAGHPGPVGLEEWIPGSEHLRGDWRAKRQDSDLQRLPPLSAAPGITALAGQVLLLNGKPASNVTLTLGAQTTRSGADGRFLLERVAPGSGTLVVDGASASQPGKSYGYYEVRVTVQADRTTALPYTIWLVKTDTQHSVTIPSPTTADVVVSSPHIPGLELHIPKGTVLRDRAGRVVTHVSITPIPIDRPPFPLPTGYVPVYFSIQPGGVHLQGIDAASAQGARLFYPNYRGEKPGTEFLFWNYDPVDKGWYVYGRGKVSADGKQVIPDPGVAIYEFTGAMISVPGIAPPEGPPPEGCPNGTPPPEGLPPCDGTQSSPPPPSGCDGDPVDCSTGLFLHSRTDVFLRDTLPIQITRTYRPRDTLSRPFGIGTSHLYGVFLVGDMFPYTYQELILPNGGRVRFNRTSPGTSYSDAVYGSTGAPGSFAGAVLQWCSPNCAVPDSVWVLTKKNGTRYFFPDSFLNSNPATGHISGIVDRYGNTITLTHDATGRLTRITSTNGRWIELTYDSSNRIATATDNIGRVVSYTYDTSGRLATVTDPEGGVESYTYDASHRMLTVTKPGGQVMVTNVYDSNGRVSQQTLADGGILTFAYTLNTAGKVTQTDITDPRGTVRRVEFNSAGYVVKETRALGTTEQSVTVVERDAQNQILAITDPLDRRTAFTYDTQGNRLTATRLAGTAQANTTTWTYEPLFNRIASVTDALGHSTLLRYDDLGNLIEVEDPLGRVAKASYDTAGRPISLTDPLNNTIQFGYDGADLQSMTDPLQRVATQFADGAGRVIAQGDALGNITRTAFDGRDLPVSRTDPAGNVTTITYDANRNLKTVVDAKGGTWTYGYDVKDRITSITNPMGKTESYAYDGKNNLTQITQRNGKVATFTYDALGRRTKAEYGRALVSGSLTAPDATVTYTYDAGSRLVQLADTQGGTISRSFDDLNRVVQESTPKGTVTYTFDAANRRSSMTAGSQTSTSYTYDNSNALLSITRGSLQASFTYDAAGRPATLTLPNGIVATYDYDVASQLTGITYRLGNTTVGDLTYQYDGAGRRIQVGGSFASTGLPQDLVSASYDAANQITSWAGTSHSYDDNGNLTFDGSRSYTFDSRNRLKAISGAITASFSYDAIGRRTDRVVGADSTGYLYDGLNPIQELTATGIKADLLMGLGIDEVLARSDGMNTTSFLSDKLGNTLALTGPSGALQTSYTYEPYGQASATGATSDNPFQYTARENDGTGLYFYRARYYDPSKGRFTQTDPIGLAGGINTYIYVHANPLNFKDPSGTQVFLGQLGEITHHGAFRIGGYGLAAEAAYMGGVYAGTAFNEWFERQFGTTPGAAIYDHYFPEVPWPSPPPPPLPMNWPTSWPPPEMCFR